MTGNEGKMLFGATAALTSLTGRTCWLNDAATQREDAEDEDAVRCYASRADTATEAVATVANARWAAAAAGAAATETEVVHQQEQEGQQHRSCIFSIAKRSSIERF